MGRDFARGLVCRSAPYYDLSCGEILMTEPRTGWSALRDVVGGVLGIVLLLWLIGAMISGPPLVAYVLIPLALLVSALSSPGVLLLLLMVLVTALVTAS